MILSVNDIKNLFGNISSLQNRLKGMPTDFEKIWNPGYDWFMEKQNPRINLYDTGEKYILWAEVPGFDKKNLNVKIQGNYLEISGSRDSIAPEGYKIQNTERDSVSFSRSMTLPLEVDSAKTSAFLKDGILYLSLSKAEEVKPKKITIG